jgi:FMN-dependent NADH-azoreductase
MVCETAPAPVSFQGGLSCRVVLRSLAGVFLYSDVVQAFVNHQGTKSIMAKLIHIQSSPRGSRSASHAVAARFTESYRAAHPGDTVDTLDLWQTDLPEIHGATLEAAYAVKRGQPHSLEQLHVWQAIVRIADRFKSADKYLVSLPMWNFSIPYKLKQYIDLLVHRGLTFSFTPEGGYKGLVTGKPLVAVYARGGA